MQTLQENKLINTAKFLLYFIDLDGTFYDQKLKASDENMKAAQDVASKKSVVFATGRGLDCTVMRVLNNIDTPYFIGLNGSMICKVNRNESGDISTEVVYTHVIDDKVCRLLTQFLIKHRYHFGINSSSYVYGPAYRIMHYIFIKHRFRRTVQRYKHFVQPDDVYKISIVTGTKRSWERLIHYMADNKLDDVLNVYTTFSGLIVEIGPKNASKGIAMEIVAKRLGINKEDCIHIGNDHNDATAVGRVGTLLAVEDAKPSLLSVANIIGPTHKPGGVAKILRGMLLLPYR